MKNKEELPKKTGFQAPEGYFGQLEDSLMEHSQSGIPKEAGFKVPEAYFESLADRVLENIEHETPVVQLQTKARKSTYRWVMTAAAACLLALLVWNPSSDDEAIWPEASELIAYLETEGMDLTSDELVDFLDEDQLEALLEEPIGELQELEAYLIDNLDDSELLIELQQ